MRWENYDPEWLAKLAEQQHPDKPWLAPALRRCTRCHKESRAYFYFVSPDRPGEAGSDWQLEANILMMDEKKRDLVLDILTGHRVGGVEFLHKL